MFDTELVKIINSSTYYVILLGAVFIPPLFWLWYFRFHDCHRPEPLKVLAFVFLLGGLGCGLLRLTFKIFDIPGLYSVASFSNYLSTFQIAIFFVLFLAFLEEILKFIVLRFYVFYHKDFDEKIDGVIYGITVGLGFATCENIMQILVHGPEVIFSRFATATLLHAVLGGLMGTFLAREKFAFFKSCCLTAKVLALTLVIHFVYNVFVLYDVTGYGINGEILVSFTAFVILLWMIHILKKKK